MNTKTQHTQTPWKVRQAYLNGEPCNYTIHTGMTTIADCSYDEQGEANAAHIVKCVNHHDELVAALTSIASYIPADTDYFRKCGEMQGAARAVLAKLEPTPDEEPEKPAWKCPWHGNLKG